MKNNDLLQQMTSHVNELSLYRDDCNQLISKFGLYLTAEQTAELAVFTKDVLKKTGRIEFDTPAAVKIIKSFCDSPFVHQDNFIETIEELVELFYYYKSEALETFSDDELIDFMRDRFDTVCQGAVELLRDRDMYTLVKNRKYKNDLQKDMVHIPKRYSVSDEGDEYYE